MTDRDWLLLLNDVLNRLERREAPLLTWGITSSAFTEPEVLAVIQEAIDAAPDVSSPPSIDVLDEALERALVVQLRYSTASGPRYRTRSAETVRLLAALRQRFPNQPWRSAPRLVADFRFAVWPRSYPRRRVPLSQVLDDLSSQRLVRTGTPEHQAVRGLLAGFADGLADFQLQATLRLLKDLKRPTRSRGTIVGAGTGSGKTLAFYLPGLVHVVRRIDEDPPDQHWTKILALYPRKELLKDQIATAFGNTTRIVDGVPGLKRPPVIAAYYGDTPHTTGTNLANKKGWTPSPNADGYVCPYIRTPDGQPMVWLDADRSRGVESLVSLDGNTVYGPDRVRLTRRSIAKSPPDILFATTAMLNRLLGDSEGRAAIGVGVPRAPELVLLDEVHTYSGAHGAQIAYLLRRWRQAVWGKGYPQFVGLSATLKGAPEFFAALTGINIPSVTEVSPSPNDMVEEGGEYLLALRSDPVSGPGVLSTTIQTLMLLERTLDPDVAANRYSQGIYGSKTFAFTDNLDVVNRLYDQLRSAEGLNFRRQTPPLAALRSPSAVQDPAQEAAMDQEGQLWWLAEEIAQAAGLAGSLSIDRTTSQDAGVRDTADVVVATASLEVGYDDPKVGAVVQHKAPLDTAGFLQRKGRAGRSRTMRPWTAVVLSDFGRDRVAYQNYDQLLNPDLEKQVLPLRNRYVLRMQAAFALMDYLALKLPRFHDGEFVPDGLLWYDLARPARLESNETWRERAQRRQDALLPIVDRLLTQPQAAQELRRYITRALRITEDEATVLLWEAPRSLMRHVVPTIHRRLTSRWTRVQANGQAADELFGETPIPEFVPSALFSDLNLPEIHLLIPERGETRIEPMAVRQALQEFAPGRISHRFGNARQGQRHWVALPDWASSDPRRTFELNGVVEAPEEVGPFQYEEAGAVHDVPVLRPNGVHLQDAPGALDSSTNSWWRWHSQLFPTGALDGIEVRLSRWASLVPRIEVGLHERGTPLEVRRFARTADATVTFTGRDGRDPYETVVDMEYDGESTALGFASLVDGLVFHVRLPDDLQADLTTPEAAREPKLRALRSEYVAHRIKTDPDLLAVANPFQLDWLAQTLTGALAALATESSEDASAVATLQEAVDSLIASGWTDSEGGAAARILAVLFDATLGEEDAESRGRHFERLSDLYGDPSVQARLAVLARLFWDPPGPDYEQWVRDRFKATLGGALLAACNAVAADADASDLMLDLEPGPRPPIGAPPPPEDEDEIWITETTAGGAGVAELLAQRIADDPRRFFDLVESALGPSDLERVDSELSHILDLSQHDAEVQTAIAGVRQARSLSDTEQAVLTLRRLLMSRGVLMTHPVTTALHARVLRPGSSTRTDALLDRLNRDWRALELALGIEIDARLFAYVASESNAYTADLPALPGAQPADPRWRFGVLYGLLWARGRALRAQALESYNPFATLPASDRLLVLDVLPQINDTVDVGASDVRERIATTLRHHGHAVVRADLGDEARLSEVLLDLQLRPLTVDFLETHPHVVAIHRDADGIRARLAADEIPQ
ncbi:MAG: hypothetical protein SangKO_099920 [Sandaracinaceae bacterium]